MFLARASSSGLIFSEIAGLIQHRDESLRYPCLFQYHPMSSIHVRERFHSLSDDDSRNHTTIVRATRMSHSSPACQGLGFTL